MNSKVHYEIYLRLFSGRQQFFAQQSENGYAPAPGKFGENQLVSHLQGLATYGIYVLTETSECNFFCIDLDIPKARLDDVNFGDSLVKYEYLRDQVEKMLEVLHVDLGIPPQATLVEDSGGRGYHIWIFLDSPVPGHRAIDFYAILRGIIDEPFEFFPKQARLASSKSYGNLIKLPLGVHRKYNKRSFFLDIEKDSAKNYEDLDGSLGRLEFVEALSSNALDSILDTFDVPSVSTQQVFSRTADNDLQRPHYVGQISYLSQKCGAIKELVAKAQRAEPLDHDEAFHFCNVLLSVDDGESFIDDNLRLSYGQKYESEFANREIERIRPLIPTSCHTLRSKNICPAYCMQSVEQQNEDDLQKNTNPLSVWLTRTHTPIIPNQEDLVVNTKTPKNIQRAYWLLKHYHEHEDALFFDPFDFGDFEADLQTNSQLVSMILDLASPVEFIGYFTAVPLTFTAKPFD